MSNRHFDDNGINISGSNNVVIIGTTAENLTVNVSNHVSHHNERYEVKDSYNRPAPRFDNDRAIEGIFDGVSNILSHILG